MLKEKFCKYRYLFNILLGSFILAFGMVNIHSRTAVTEGGIWGLELLIDHWFHIPPGTTAPFLDGFCYVMGIYYFGKPFILKSIVGTLSFAGFYTILDFFPPVLPDLSSNLLLAAIVGALFVGVGAGLVVREGGASAGDDALALVLSKKLHIKISNAYLFSDLSVLLLSLSYIPFSQIFYSLITVILSGKIIDIVQMFHKDEKE